MTGVHLILQNIDALSLEDFIVIDILNQSILFLYNEKVTGKKSQMLYHIQKSYACQATSGKLVLVSKVV